MAFQFSFLQANNASSINTGVTNVLFSNTTPGSILFAMSLGDSPSSLVKDTAGNTNWSKLGSIPLVFSQGFSDLWWCPNNVGGPNTIMAQTSDAGGIQDWAVAEYSSITGAFKDDFASSFATGGTTSESVGPVTTTQATDTLIYLAAILNAGADTIDVTSPFVLDSNQITVNSRVLLFASDLAGAAGPYSAGLSTSGGRLWVNYLIALAAPSGPQSKGWSPVDCRVAVPGYGPAANFGVVQPDGSVHYVGQVSSNEHIPTPTSNPNLPPIDSRALEPENSRVDPSTVGPD